MSCHELAQCDGDEMERILLILFEMEGEDEIKRGGEESEGGEVSEKVNSRYVVENVLMGYGGAYIGNKGNKRCRRWCNYLIPAPSDLLPHAHTQASKTYNWHQRFKKARKLKTHKDKVIINVQIKIINLGEIVSFQDDARYEHVGPKHKAIQGCSLVESVGLHQTKIKVSITTIKIIQHKERFKDLSIKDKVKKQ
ncbi:hypothetical protein Tco_1554906 [Tanacetum coccineum]